MQKTSTFQPSLLNNLYEKASQPVTWATVFNLITADASVMQLTGVHRTTPSDELKRRLPCFTPAVQLDGEGKGTTNIVGYTGYTMCDIDHIPADRIDEVRRRVNADPHTFMSNVTVSGHGMHIIAPYAQGMDYDVAFQLMNSHYARLTGCDYDEQCANHNRTFSLSHDPQAHFNPKAQAFEHHLPAYDDEEEFRTFWRKVPKDKIAATVEFAQKRGVRYVEHNRHNYLVFCIFHMNKLGVPRYDAERWIGQFHDRKEHERRAIMKSIYDQHSSDHGTYDEPYEWVAEERRREAGKFTSSQVHKPASPTRARSNSHTGYASHNDDPLADSEVLNQKQRQDYSRCIPLVDYDWPWFIRQMVEQADTKPQRDVLLMGVITILGGMLGRVVKVNYSKRYWYPALQTFVIAPPASGKSVIMWARRLADPLNRMLERQYDEAKRQYDRQKAEYDNAGKERANMQCPEPPRLNVYHIAGNNSSSGIIENLDDCGGWALICEAEADTLSAAINADYGNWGDILRKAFDHDLMIMFRRTNKERRKIENPCLSVLISGTPAQVKPLIVSAENGQFSREIFLQLPAIDEFIDQFADEGIDMDARFMAWGRQWLEVWRVLQRTTGSIELRLTAAQREVFNEHFSELFHHADYTQPTHHMKSSVAREAINILRIMSVVAFFRALESLADGPGDLTRVLRDGTLPLQDSPLFVIPDDTPSDNLKDGIVTRYNMHITDADFEACLSLADPLYRYACEILSLLPSTEAQRNSVSSTDRLLSLLPLRFNYAEAVEIGAEMGISSSNVSTILNRLVDDGKLVKPCRGSYELSFPSRVCVRGNAVNS